MIEMDDKLIQELEQLFTKKGFNPVVGDIYKQQAKWRDWYRGDVNDFHYFQITTTNGATDEIYKGSLQMPKKSCEDWSSLLWNNECELKTNDNTAQERLDTVLFNNDFQDEIHGFIERSFANGTGVSVQYIADGEVKIDFIYGDKTMVLDYHNTTIKSIGVIQEFVVEQSKYTHVQYHLFKDGIYHIEHEIYKKGDKKRLQSQVSLGVLFNEDEIESMKHVEVDEDGIEHVKYYVEYETAFPHFQILKPALVNNFDWNHPMGISVFGNSIAATEGIDGAYYSLRTEDENTRKHVYVSDEGTKTQVVKERDGNTVTLKHMRYFNRDDTLHRSMKMPDEKPIEAYGPDHNGLSIIESLNQHLNTFGFKCGFGTNFYSFKDGAVYVNEKNVTTSNMDLFNTRQKHIARLKSVLFKMMYAILFLEQQLGNYQGNLDLDYEVITDDSIMEDDATLIERYNTYAQNGWIEPYHAIAKGLNLSLEEAKELYEEALTNEDARFNSFIGGEIDEQTEED